MERVPAYSCCVQGDARHWRRCLEQVIPLHNERAASEEEKVTKLPPLPNKFGWWMKNIPRGEELWKEYANESRPWLAATPGREAAMCLMSKCEEIVKAAAFDDNMSLTTEEADEALREIVQILLDWTTNASKDGVEQEEVSDNARKMAQFASEALSVPRDISMIPALALGELAQSLITE